MTPGTQNQPDQLWLMLGEIRTDLKYLIDERRSTTRRLDEVEAELKGMLEKQNARITKLEAFKIRVGVLTGALGVLVPTAISVIAHKMGLLQ